MNRVYWGTVLAALWMICFYAHGGLAIFLGILAGLAASIYWLIGSRSLWRIALATFMSLVAYFFSVSPVFVLIVNPLLERRMAGDAAQVEDGWIDNIWEQYATPWAKVGETGIGNALLVPYHKKWVSTLN